jgi:hypothetical protein
VPPWSSGKDAGFSARRPGFDSPWGYHFFFPRIVSRLDEARHPSKRNIQHSLGTIVTQVFREQRAGSVAVKVFGYGGERVKMTKSGMFGLAASILLVSFCVCEQAVADNIPEAEPAPIATEYLQTRDRLQAVTDVAPEIVAARTSDMRGRVVEVAGEIVGRTAQETDSANPFSFVLRPTGTDSSVFVDAAKEHAVIEVGSMVHVLVELPVTAHPLDHYQLRAMAPTSYLPVEQHNRATTPSTQPDITNRQPGNVIKTDPLADLPSTNIAEQAGQDLVQTTITRPGSEFPSMEQWGTSEAVNTWVAWVLKRNSRLTDVQARLIVECVLYYSQKFRIDHRLAFAMIKYESDFNPSCRSHAGAMGLTQLMPGTARSVGVSDPWDIRQNIMGGIRYLSAQLHKYEGRSNYEQTILGLACYNAGPNAVKRAGGVPNYTETQRYVKRVTDLFRQLWEDGMP